MHAHTLLLNNNNNSSYLHLSPPPGLGPSRLVRCSAVTDMTVINRLFFRLFPTGPGTQRAQDSVAKIRGQLNQQPGLVVASVRVRVLSECRSEDWSLWISSSSGTLTLLTGYHKLVHSLAFLPVSVPKFKSLPPPTPAWLPLVSLLWFPPDILAETELSRSNLWPFKKQGISYLISATLPAVASELAHPNLELEK